MTRVLRPVLRAVGWLVLVIAPLPFLVLAGDMWSFLAGIGFAAAYLRYWRAAGHAGTQLGRWWVDRTAISEPNVNDVSIGDKLTRRSPTPGHTNGE